MGTVAPGRNSTEWKAILAAFLIQVGLAVGVVNEDEAAKIRAYEWGSIATVAAAVAYAGLRTYLKIRASAEGEDPEVALKELELTRSEWRTKAARLRAAAETIDARLNEKLDTVARLRPQPPEGPDAT